MLHRKSKTHTMKSIAYTRIVWVGLLGRYKFSQALWVLNLEPVLNK